jgi:PAS domain S-box-containing protein
MEGIMLGAIESEITGNTCFEAVPYESGDLFEKVFNCQPDAVLILDNDCTPNIVECNPSAERIFAYSKEELVGQPISLLHANGEVLEQFKQSIISSVGKLGFCHFPELWMRRRDGTLFPCEYSVAPLQDQGRERSGWITVTHEISKRIETEKALKASAEKIKRFAYSLCHDLKNPAIALRWFAERLADRYGQLLDEQGNMCCDRIRKASEEIVLFVDNLNEYISTKEIPMSIVQIDLDEIFQIVKEEFLQRAKALGVELSAPTCSAKLRGDRMSLIRALRNLIENALKHGGDRLSQISLGYRESDKFHIIAVKDDGVGLMGEDSNEIFKCFWRGRHSKGIPGAGLGLSIVKEVALCHGGSISIEPGPQTEFLLSISKRL